MSERRTGQCSHGNYEDCDQCEARRGTGNYADQVRDGYKPPIDDAINHPTHYTSHPSGVECITITEHMGFCVGNAVKYLWRADLKGDAIEDLQKAAWYIQREIQRRKGTS